MGNNITEIMTAAMVVAVIIEIITAVIITSIETEEATRGRLHTITNQIITEIIFIDEVVDDKNSYTIAPTLLKYPRYNITIINEKIPVTTHNLVSSALLS